MCPAQKIISSVLCALLLAGCLSCAAQPFLGLYNSTKGFGVNAIRSVPGQNEFDNYTLYADIYGLPLGQSAAPGGFFSYTRDYIFRTIEIDEIVFDFYDKLKSISKGYASFDYHVIGFKEAKLVKLDILLNGDPADALSTLIHADHAYDFGRKMCEKLKELIPRQQFDIAIQAAVGAKIIARETVKAVRKDVTAKCYGGDISRKRKLLEKQKQGKKRMRQIGTVEVPQSAFMAVLKLD